MSTTTSMLERMSTYDAWKWATDLFEHQDYYRAAEILAHLVETDEDAARTGDVRELLTRAYYHSAQVVRAADAARALLELEPTNAYAALLLARSLERGSRRDEADSARRLAVALGAPA